MSVIGLDHVQVAAPAGCEAAARHYYGQLLGLAEVEKPEPLRARGGAWFRLGAQQLHVGVDEDFAPARKAHPAIRVADRTFLEALAEHLGAAGFAVAWDEELSDAYRFYSEDPWGNRVELLAERSEVPPDPANLSEGAFAIRRARRADAPTVLELWSGARSGHASSTDRLEDVESLLAASSPAALLVAEQDDEIVGALIAGWDGWRGNMYRLAVRADYRRRGIGLALTRAGEDYLRERGISRVTALVAFEEEAAGGFWESAGYPPDREIGRRVRNI